MLVQWSQDTQIKETKGNSRRVHSMEKEMDRRISVTLWGDVLSQLRRGQCWEVGEPDECSQSKHDREVEIREISE